MDTQKSRKLTYAHTHSIDVYSHIFEATHKNEAATTKMVEEYVWNEKKVSNTLNKATRAP